MYDTVWMVLVQTSVEQVDWTPVLLDLLPDVPPGNFRSEKTLRVLPWHLVGLFLFPDTFSHQLV